MKSFFKSYAESFILLAAIAAGALVGGFFPESAPFLKPIGTVWLNLLSTAVVPLVFFSIASTIAGMDNWNRLGKIVFWMMIVFIVASVICAVLMLAGVYFYPPTAPVHLELSTQIALQPWNAGKSFVEAFTVNDFGELLSRKNMLALILFSGLMGWAVQSAGKAGEAFRQHFLSGNAVMMQIIRILMKVAPIGLGAYFAVLTAEMGPQLMGTYGRVAALYYPLSFFYFFVFFTIYAWWAGGAKWLPVFWKEIMPPALTALGSGSSLATVPSNLQAADRMGIPREVSEIVIPIGAVLHKSGSCLAAILKIALLHQIFQVPFAGVESYAIAVAVAVLSGVVMGGIPGGGFLGEMLIVTLYGFPLEGLPIISMVGTIVDPPATLVNAIGDNIAAAIVARIVYGKKWRVKPIATA